MRWKGGNSKMWGWRGGSWREGHGDGRSGGREEGRREEGWKIKKEGREEGEIEKREPRRTSMAPMSDRLKLTKNGGGGEQILSLSL